MVVFSPAGFSSFRAETSANAIGRNSPRAGGRHRAYLVQRRTPLRLQMPSVSVVGRAGALGRYHCRPQRTLRSAQCAERRAIMRLLNAPQNLPADAYLRFEGGNLRHIEQLLRVLRSKLVAQTVAAHGNVANPSPLAVTHAKDTIHQLLRRGVAVTA